jgi:hypothetical protein
MLTKLCGLSLIFVPFAVKIMIATIDNFQVDLSKP